MKFITLTIKNDSASNYSRLCRALENSIKENCKASFENHCTEKDPVVTYNTHYLKYIEQTVKLRKWEELIKSESGNVCFIDADTVVLKDVNHVFDLDFDIAYTQREPGATIRLNTGVLFVRVNERSIHFFQEWTKINEQMQENEPFHKEYHARYHGMDQTSFGYMLENNRCGANILPLPCHIYNACTVESWTGINEETAILHIKSQLRIDCLNYNTAEFKKAVDTWEKYNY